MWRFSFVSDVFMISWPQGMQQKRRFKFSRLSNHMFSYVLSLSECVCFHVMQSLFLCERRILLLYTTRISPRNLRYFFAECLVPTKIKNIRIFVTLIRSSLFTTLFSFLGRLSRTISLVVASKLCRDCSKRFASAAFVASSEVNSRESDHKPIEILWP